MAAWLGNASASLARYPKGGLPVGPGRTPREKVRLRVAFGRDDVDTGPSVWREGGKEDSCASRRIDEVVPGRVNPSRRIVSRGSDKHAWAAAGASRTGPARPWGAPTRQVELFPSLVPLVPRFGEDVAVGRRGHGWHVVSRVGHKAVGEGTALPELVWLRGSERGDVAMSRSRRGDCPRQTQDSRGETWVDGGGKKTACNP